MYFQADSKSSNPPSPLPPLYLSSAQRSYSVTPRSSNLPCMVVTQSVSSGLNKSPHCLDKARSSISYRSERNLLSDAMPYLWSSSSSSSVLTSSSTSSSFFSSSTATSAFAYLAPCFDPSSSSASSPSHKASIVRGYSSSVSSSSVSSSSVSSSSCLSHSSSAGASSTTGSYSGPIVLKE
jgi:mating pheromone-induced death protein 2